MTAKCGTGGEWEYPAVDEAIDNAGLCLFGVYITRRKMAIAERVACRFIYALCTEAEQITGTIRMVYRWDQDALNELKE